MFLKGLPVNRLDAHEKCHRNPQKKAKQPVVLLEQVPRHSVTPGHGLQHGISQVRANSNLYAQGQCFYDKKQDPTNQGNFALRPPQRGGLGTTFFFCGPLFLKRHLSRRHAGWFLKQQPQHCLWQTNAEWARPTFLSSAFSSQLRSAQAQQRNAWL